MDGPLYHSQRITFRIPTHLFLVGKILEEIIIFHLYLSKGKSSFIMSYLVHTYLELINFAQPGQLSKIKVAESNIIWLYRDSPASAVSICCLYLTG